MASFSLANFQAQVKSRGLARVNRFEILIKPPRYTNKNINNQNARLVSLFAEVSNMPPINISVRPLKIYAGPTYQRPIGSEYGGDGISMTFHVDREMKVKRFFDDWMETIIDRNTYEVAFQDVYRTDITINQLDERDRITYGIDLLEAFPRSMNLMELNQSAQNQTHRLNVIFAYRYWRRTDIEARREALPLVSPQTLPNITQNVPVQNFPSFSWSVDRNTGGTGADQGSNLPVSS
jgi:hypothetical protein